jgi:integrase
VSNPRKRESSRSRDSSILSQHVLPAIGALQLSKVTKQRCQELVDGWAATLKPSTVVRQAATLRALFSFALDSEMILRSPAARLRLPQMELVRRPELSAGDLERLAKALGPDEAAMMWVGAVTGLRWAECAGLTLGDVDLTNGTIRVERQLDRDRQLVTLKTKAARRELAIPDWLANDLRNHLARRGSAIALPSALVFTAAQGKPLHYSNWRRRVWRPACEAAGLPGLGFHDLRSNNATALVDEGINPKVLQQRLGHANVSTTLGIYARATKKADRSAADVLGARLRPRATVVPINSTS